MERSNMIFPQAVLWHYLHELCHALGLKHPHDLGLNGQPRFPGLSRRSNEFRDAGDFGQNAHPGLSSVM